MLSPAQNTLLTEVGPETRMGNLLRRYWHPIAAVAELDDQPTKPVRLMGEDLVLYKDKGGRYGLVDRHCAHRRADLSYGFVEECGLRCNYHGWLYDEKGNCIAQPYEERVNPAARFKDKIELKAYPVEAKAGLLFAYLGPQPMPLLPNWEPFTFQNGFVQIVVSEIPCNWLQCQENSIDPVHFEWMHDNWGVRLSGADGPYSPPHLELEFKEFEFGLTYHRVREGQPPNNELWTVGRAALWPNIFFIGHFEYRVPVDDANTLSVLWFFSRVPKEREPYLQTRIPYWYAPIRDPETGRWISSHVVNQDYVGWVGQGTVADRSQEHLGRSDRGVIMLRRRFLADIEAIERGEDPKGIVRDQKQNECIRLPMIGRDFYVEGVTQQQLDASAGRIQATPDNFPFLAGQPDEVRLAYEEAMGFRMKEFSLGSFVNLGKGPQSKPAAA
jgi:5,5'-dehydrodivanillate O-demethylase oxygenase subunit